MQQSSVDFTTWLLERYGEYLTTSALTPPFAYTREWVLARDSRKCRYCGLLATEVDHVVPRSKGGSDLSCNLVASCRSCNLAAWDRDFIDIDAKQRFIVASRFG